MQGVEREVIDKDSDTFFKYQEEDAKGSLQPKLLAKVSGLWVELRELQPSLHTTQVELVVKAQASAIQKSRSRFLSELKKVSFASDHRFREASALLL